MRMKDRSDRKYLQVIYLTEYSIQNDTKNSPNSIIRKQAQDMNSYLTEDTQMAIKHMLKKMFSTTDHQGNAKQGHNRMSVHPHSDSSEHTLESIECC
jgi:hypothetical protein